MHKWTAGQSARGRRLKGGTSCATGRELRGVMGRRNCRACRLSRACRRSSHCNCNPPIWCRRHGCHEASERAAGVVASARPPPPTPSRSKDGSILESILRQQKPTTVSSFSKRPKPYAIELFQASRCGACLFLDVRQWHLSRFCTVQSPSRQGPNSRRCLFSHVLHLDSSFLSSTPHRCANQDPLLLYIPSAI